MSRVARSASDSSARSASPRSLARIRSNRRSNPAGATGRGLALRRRQSSPACGARPSVRMPTCRGHRSRHPRQPARTVHRPARRRPPRAWDASAGAARRHLGERAISTTPMAPPQSASPKRTRSDSATLGRRMITPRLPVISDLLKTISRDAYHGILTPAVVSLSTRHHRDRPTHLTEFTWSLGVTATSPPIASDLPSSFYRFLGTS